MYFKSGQYDGPPDDPKPPGTGAGDMKISDTTSCQVMVLPISQRYFSDGVAGIQTSNLTFLNTDVCIELLNGATIQSVNTN